MEREIWREIWRGKYGKGEKRGDTCRKAKRGKHRERDEEGDM